MFDRNHLQMLWLAGFTAAEAKVLYVADAHGKSVGLADCRGRADFAHLWDFWDRQAAKVRPPY